ncbi:hypothetical protein D3C80_1718910 [compost metagenome]
MGGKHHRPVVRALVQLLDEDRPHALQPLDDVAVVDDLVADIDGSAELLDGALDDLDGPIHPGAEAARRGEPHVQGAAIKGGGRCGRVHGPEPSRSRPFPPPAAWSRLPRLALAAISIKRVAVGADCRALPFACRK